jgi:adenylate cyclase class 2
MSTRKDEALETEVKIAVRGAREARTSLRAAGFLLRRRRVFESNTIYDTTTGALRRQRHLLRIRTAGRDVLVTFKGAPLPGPHKRRPEYEFNAASAEDAARVFAALGFAPFFRYEKYRTEFERPDEPGFVTLDETPIGVFLELEGPPAWIDRTARLLGFSRDDYITLSYAALYLEWRRAMPTPAAHMVFVTRPAPSRWPKMGM